MVKQNKNRFLFCFDGTGNTDGAGCVEKVALLKEKTERSFETYKVYSGKRNGRQREREYVWLFCKCWFHGQK